MFQTLLNKQKKHIDFFFRELELDSCEHLVKKVCACKGVIFFSGIGKSGFIAQKLAATMMSMGTKAAFLSPTDALHGDLGMVGEEDLLFLLSKSGETDELLELLPYLRLKGVAIIALTSNRDSRLVKGADDSIFLPCIGELCPFDLAPTTSSELQLLFGHLLAVAVMETKGISLLEFASNHPGGRIGKRASLKVKEMMLDSTEAPLCSPERRLEEVLIDFSEKRCGCLVVIDKDKKLKGIFTDGDLRRALQAKGDKVLRERLGDLMNEAPKAIDIEASAWDAMKLMESDQKHPTMVLPVIETDKVVGVIKMHDLIQAGL